MSRFPQSGFVGALRRADEILFAGLRLALILLMSAMVLSVLGQVFSRYVLNASLNWSEELARLCMVCLVFLGVACLTRSNEHLAVTSLVDLLSDRLRSLFLIFTHGVGLYCAWYLMRGALRALDREWAQLTPAMQLPMGVIYSTVFGAILLMILWLIANIVTQCLSLAGSGNGTEMQ
ncbi:MAG: TRAP transporter small permease [Proteobacteria bacterium]|nr:TRAP transporter small permease [Pseudomonadota bacterium]